MSDHTKKLAALHDQMLLPTYSAIPTFMRTPYHKDLSNLDIAFVGIPFDGGTTGLSGAKLGPREMRNQSTMLGLQNHHSGIIPYFQCRIGDIGDVPLSNPHSLEQTVNDIELFYNQIKEHNIIPITAGGDHSITYPILKALGKEKPLAIIHIDSHCDTAPELGGNTLQHGSTFYNAVKAGVIDPTKTIQIGIRGGHEYLWDFSYTSGMHVFHIEDVYKIGLPALIEKIHTIIGNQPVYISFDIDGIDPAFAPGTGTPEVGGLTSYEGQQLIRGLQGLNIVGADVVEVAPPLDPTYRTALLGATLMFEILCIVTNNIQKKSTQ